MKCFILVGPESSGNHVFCSLFSQLKCGHEPIVGTDLAGWTDGRHKFHSEEAFEDVWLGRKELDVRAPFVTSRSVPCGLVMPDIVGFCNVARKLGFDPLVVVISRDMNINAMSARHHGHPWPTSRGISHIKETMRQVRCTVVSYEALVLYKELYFDAWLKEHAPEFTCEPKWFNFIKDENKKCVK